MPRLFKCSVGSDAAGKIRKVDTEVTVRVLAEKVVMSATLPDPQARLPLDAFDRADRDILLRVWNGHTIPTIRMPKLMVTPFHADEAPSRSLELANDCPAVHAAAYHLGQGVTRQAGCRPGEPA
jgi:hypothetical protein